MTATITERPTQSVETTAAASRHPGDHRHADRRQPPHLRRRHDCRHGRRHGHGCCRRRHRYPDPHVRLLRPGCDHHGRGHLRRRQPPPGPLSVGNSNELTGAPSDPDHAPQATQDPDPARQGHRTTRLRGQGSPRSHGNPRAPHRRRPSSHAHFSIRRGKQSSTGPILRRPRRSQNMPLSLAEVSGITWSTSQCSTIRPRSSRRKMSMPA